MFFSLRLLIIFLFYEQQLIFAEDHPSGNRQTAKISADTQKEKAFGILATDLSLDIPMQNLPEHPPLSNTGKSYRTYNSYGFDIINQFTSQNSWVIETLSKFVTTIKLPVLDVGGGYGGLSCLLAQQGATVIYNDIEKTHLLFGRKKLTESQRHHVYMNTQAFPEEMDFPPGSLGAIVLYRVLHFMAPEQIEAGLAKAYRWLASGGKIFIVVLTPQHTDYREKVLQHYEELWQQGEDWPGKGLNSKEILPNQAYALPSYIHVMDERPLRKALEKYQFEVEQTGFISLQKFGNTPNRDGKESFGIIAVKR